jgi:ribonucleotide monophosphatase NagD (HAD superfamily)
LPYVHEACDQLRSAGYHLQFATNNSAPTNATLRERLAKAGIDCDDRDLVTAAQAAASLLTRGTQVLTV